METDNEIYVPSDAMRGALAQIMVAVDTFETGDYLPEEGVSIVHWLSKIRQYLDFVFEEGDEE